MTEVYRSILTSKQSRLSKAVDLFTCHRSGGRPFPFLGFLNEGAQSTEHDHKQIIRVGPIDSFGRSGLSADFRHRPETDATKHGEDAVLDTAFPVPLGVFPGGNTRQEVRHYAQPEVVEASEKTVGPFTHFGRFVFFSKVSFKTNSLL